MNISPTKHWNLPESTYAALVNIVLLCAPLILAGKFLLIVINIRIITFLILVTVWCFMEIRFHPTQSECHATTAKWFPSITGVTILVILWASLLECAHENNLTDYLNIIGGILLFVVGVLLRYISIRTLGPYFHNEIILSLEQPLVTHGIYGILRHPSETGMLAIAFGSQLVLGSQFGTILSVFVLVPLVIWRIKLEDQMLRKQYPTEFLSYAKKVPSVIPFFYFDKDI